jgi:RimJ/RimL family protein N-acetyltransferase
VRGSGQAASAGHSTSPSAANKMTPPAQVLKTERLVLRHLSPGDAPFILRLLNEPSWLENIGDKGVRTAAEAQRYIEMGPVEMYGRLGFGLYQVRLTISDEPIGICGLLKRETLENVDLGFAFFPEFWGNGYAREASAAVLSYARNRLGLARIVAVTARNNHTSHRVLEKLGFELERSVHLVAGGEELLLYANAA